MRTKGRGWEQKTSSEKGGGGGKEKGQTRGTRRRRLRMGGVKEVALGNVELQRGGSKTESPTTKRVKGGRAGKKSVLLQVKGGEGQPGGEHIYFVHL